MTNHRPILTATIYDKRGKVLSTGQNSYVKTHPIQAKLSKRAGHPLKQFLHAEISALIKCKGDPYKIKIERYDRDGQAKLAKPCDVCELAIKEAGIKFIEYTIG